MTEEEIKNIAAEFYGKENISTIKEIGNRLIIEFKDIAEDKNKSQKLKNILQTREPAKKINLLFAEEKTVNIGVQALEKWQISGVKKIIGVASGKGGVGNLPPR